MIKNELTKYILTNTIFRLLSVLNKVIPKDDKTILLYTNMGFRDNIKAIYDYLIENEYNSTYKILISSNEKITERLPLNVHYINTLNGVIDYLRAGHVFYAFGRIPIYPSKNQYVVQMWHGTPFKAPDKRQLQTVSRKSYYTSMLISSDYFKEVVKRAQGVKDENIVICGQPRTDIMFRQFEKYPELSGYKKVVIWMPTFRKSKTLGYADIKEIESFTPIFHTSDYINLNEWLKKSNILLIIKLHPMEDISDFESMNLSNLFLLSHSEFISKKWNLYKLIAQCDAMITDYSSVFYDFMLLDRPIAFTVDDIEGYKEGRGFAVENPDYLTAGYKIKNKLQFYGFLKDLLNNMDLYADVRRKVNMIVNTYNDGQQCKRTLKIANIYIEE
ncbi:CDP-glycerol glycerophosphotransferase family protein [Enterocloster bolteae]|jgi:CDP-glycerol glycerophosphotransferase (TagB/SpsB family)|uniref:CDP-glycerol glycerophosphotransferase family protein n=1 Tax=Enterocloster sp. OA11 TaxID=2914162 RepID=UPI0011058990|nr:CDP-glycerol glycerophosphotransferase family protein [Enterocloster sp. OA11]MCB7093022.1 CDP-glycerol glycerophosphotransferase family protein [Enterocloster bolteae]MCH1938334.1 CDP-glycerol glycerophosphotransferase family protein [Enterocloster sp. OA11]